MTVCIGALAGSEYVCVSDQLLAAENILMSAAREGHYSKTSPIGSNWLLSFSGAAPDFVGFMQRLPAGELEEKMPSARVIETLTKAYNEQWLERLNGVLQKHGIDHPTFVRKGRQWFGDEKFAEMNYELENAWQLDCVVGGVWEDQPAIVFTLGTRGVHRHELPGFAAVGIGATTAMTVLYQSYDPGDSPDWVTARLLDAKFAAEASPYVGKNTTAWRLADGKKTAVLQSDTITTIREAWLRRRRDFNGEAASEIRRLWNA